MGIPRTLSLHESALSPAEYSSYVSLFHDLVEPPDATVGVREAKAFLRGRLNTIDVVQIDKILRFFCPALAAGDQLSEGQFYAAMRLISHVNAGRTDIEPALVFVQPLESSIPLSGSSVQASSPPRQDTSTPTTNATYNSNNPFVARGRSTTTTSNPAGTTTTSGRPFSNSISNSASALSSDEGSVPDFAHVHSRASSSPAPSVPNPFFARANSIPQSMMVAPALPPAPTQAPSSVSSSKPVGVPNAPPALPPRKPTFLPPPRHASQQQVPQASVPPPLPSKSPGSVGSNSTLPYKEREPPLKPPKPPMHITASTRPPTQATSPLIERGLAAAKSAQRSAERSVEKLRTWEIIKSSSSPSSVPIFDGSRPEERERASSVSSAERNGTVRIHSTTRHTRSVSRAGEPVEAMSPGGDPFDTPTRDDPITSPVSDGAFIVSTPNPATRVAAPNLSTMERQSVQIGSTTPGSDTAAQPSWMPAEGFGSVRRRAAAYEEGQDGPFRDSSSGSVRLAKRNSSLGHGLGQAPSDASTTSSIAGGASTMASQGIASLQQHFHNLGVKARPGLESARAKVEGKFIHGGYSKWGAESLNSSPEKHAGGVGTLRRNFGTRKPGASDEGSDEFEDADDLLSTDDDVHRNGWKPLKG
ncbi:SubName: Full=Uncharacterized protein {ECO:0000313/EMBL:CCA77845.1} [Serendipita indica DSM 11827]|nr:SubName: Full=Uncharacterized protein {ECO:0000313/EMBL:CCA77845.1} [Serendipita indica DSM 11827]